MRIPGSWTGLLIAGALIALSVLWSERVPVARPASVPATEFSAERAWPTLSMLADTIGLRVAGTPGADRALAWLATRARAIPGAEVEIQDVTGFRSDQADLLVAYRTKNLLIRIPGRARDAVLVSSHYDSPTSSVGAVDAGVAVASMLEMAANIAASPRLPRTIIFNINGAEEQGLLGAHGFLGHRWMREVRVFIDLESAGTANKALLFQTGPGHAWLAKRYARSVPHPYGTVLGQDIFQSGAIPSSTDFEIYRDGAHVPGVDIAFYRNGYAYHTQLDRTWNTTPGSVQHMGANALALTRALAEGEIPAGPLPRRAVYYDLLGVTMLAYEESTALILALLTAVLAVGAVTITRRRLSLRLADIAASVGISLAAWLFGLALAILVSLVAALAAGKPHSWFAHPFLPFAGYGALALGPLFALHSWIARRRRLTPDNAVASAWAGALLFMTMPLVLLAFLGVGSGYLFLWWVGPAAVGLIMFAHLSARWRALSAITLVPGTMLTMQAAVLLLEFRSIGGRMPLAVPYDVVMSGIVALIAVMLFTIPIALAHTDRLPGRVGLALMTTGIVAIALGALRFPYSPLRPQRLAVSHRESADSSVLRVTGFDYVGPRAAIAAFPNARVVANGTRRRGPYTIISPRAGLAPAELTLISTSHDSTRDERTLTLHVAASDAFAHQISVPGARFVRWQSSDSLRGTVAPRPSDAIAQLVSAPDTGWTIEVTVRGVDPVSITSTAFRAVVTPAARAMIARLPAWTSAYATAQARRTITF